MVGFCAFDDVGDRGDALKDLRASSGVTLHDSEFFIGQFARLIQDFVWDCDFADVMEKGDVIDVIDFVLAHPEVFGDELGIIADAGGVAVRVFVLRVDRAGDSLNRFDRDVFIFELLLKGLVGLESDDEECASDDHGQGQEADKDPEPSGLIDLHLLDEADFDLIGLLTIFVDGIGAEGVFAAGEVRVVDVSFFAGNHVVIIIDPVHLVIDLMAFAWPEAKDRNIDGDTVDVFGDIDGVAIEAFAI